MAKVHTICEILEIINMGQTRIKIMKFVPHLLEFTCDFEKYNGQVNDIESLAAINSSFLHGQ